MENREKTTRRVGMVVHTCYLIDARVRRQAEFLSEKGFDVHVVSARQPCRLNGSWEPSHEIVNGVHIHRISLSKKRGSKLRYFFEYTAMTFLGLWKLSLLHLRKKFHVIHIHNMPDFLVFSGLIPKWFGAPLVLDIHDPMSELFQETYHLDGSHPLIRAIELQERISYKFADYLLTVSTPMAENIVKKTGYSEEAIKVVHNFPNLKLFPVCLGRKQWPYNKDKILFLYSGTVTEHYRLDIAVKALAKVSQTIPNIKFQILGGGSRLQEMLTLAKDLGIGYKVEHLQPVSQDKVKDVMSKADIGITTHQSGVFGDLYFSTKIIEFMTQGLPVISSRTYTIEKYIPENAIFYFEPEQVDDLVRQILFMYNNPGLVLEKIQASKNILSKLTWQEEQDKFLSFYEELFNSHHEENDKHIKFSNSRISSG